MRHKLALLALVGALVTDLGVVKAQTEPFTYFPPGHLIKESGAFDLSTGVEDYEVHAPDMLFPLKVTAFANSQLFSPGGSEYKGGDATKGWWANPRNFRYPWRDNFCEWRDDKNHWVEPCPTQWAHQGQDIRALTKDNKLYAVVAAEDAVVWWASSKSGGIVLQTLDRERLYMYLHMSTTKVVDDKVAQTVSLQKKQRVVKGQVIGFVSQVASEPTSVHLHFELHKRKRGADGKLVDAWSAYTRVSPYLSLIRAYERFFGSEGTMLDAPAVCTPSTSRCAPRDETFEKNTYKHSALITCSADGTSETLSWCPGATCGSAQSCGPSTAPSPPPRDMSMGVPDMSAPEPDHPRYCFGFPPPRITWKPKTSFGHRDGYTKMLAYQGAVHAVGTDTTMHGHRVYDPVRDVWDKATFIPYSNPAYAIVVADDTLYIPAAVLQPVMQRYYPLSDTWGTFGMPGFSSMLPQFPVVADGTAIYLLNGYDMAAYNLATNTWKNLTVIDQGLVDSAAVYKGQLFVFGSERTYYQGMVHRFDLVSGSWIQLAGVPDKIWTSAAVHIGDTVWRFGGLKPRGTMTEPVNSIALFHLPTGQWCTGTAFLPDWMAKPLVAFARGRLYVVDDDGDFWEGTPN